MEFFDQRHLVGPEVEIFGLVFNTTDVLNYSW